MSIDKARQQSTLAQVGNDRAVVLPSVRFGTTAHPENLTLANGDRAGLGICIIESEDVIAHKDPLGPDLGGRIATACDHSKAEQNTTDGTSSSQALHFIHQSIGCTILPPNFL